MYKQSDIKLIKPIKYSLNIYKAYHDDSTHFIGFVVFHMRLLLVDK